MVLRRINVSGEQPSQPAQSSGTSAMTSGGPPAQHDQQDRPVSPAGSLYAMSDDEEGEYNTITHTQSGKGVKLLYSKSKVCLSVLNFATFPSFEYLSTHTVRELTFMVAIGLHTSYTLCQRQYTRLYRSASAKVTCECSSFLR